MIIYPQEINDGVADILSKTTLAYTSEILEKDRKVIRAALADPGITDPTLYPFADIMVSSNTNKNDDVFLPAEIIKAKDTPINKPLNWNHINQEVIGTILSSELVDNNLNVLDPSTPLEELPDLFHITTNNVIWKFWEDPEYRQAIANLIDEIEQNLWSVSMECTFGSISYGVMDDNRTIAEIIPRNEKTSFLTKHLRSYGGAGTYQNMKLARVLHDITFSGKGIVKKPANPNSTILKNIPRVKSSLVYVNNDKEFSYSSEKQRMDQELLKAQIEALKADLVTAKKAKDDMKDELDAKKDKEAKAYVVEINNLTDKLSKANDKIAELNAKVTSTEKLVETFEGQLTAAKKDSSDYEKKAEEMYKGKAKAERRFNILKASLADKAYEPVFAKANELVDNFGDLNDDMFNKVVAAIDTFNPNPKPLLPVTQVASPEDFAKQVVNSTPKNNDVQINTKTAVASEDELDEASPTGDQTSAASVEVDKIESVRASIADKMGKKYIKTARKLYNNK